MALDVVLQEFMASELEVCPRCMQAHTLLAWQAFRKPPLDANGDNVNYWALCPLFREPILLSQWLTLWTAW